MRYNGGIEWDGGNCALDERERIKLTVILRIRYKNSYNAMAKSLAIARGTLWRALHGCPIRYSTYAKLIGGEDEQRSRY